MKLTFLSAAVPLTKTFVLNSGEIQKQAHPKVTSCTTHFEEVRTIEEFKNALDVHAAQGHCLLKGNTNRALNKESRAGTTDANEKTKFTCLDIDGIQGCSDVNDLLKPMGIADVDHIIQYSSSMGVIPDRGMSAHVFLLNDDAMPAIMKQWLIGLNLTLPILVDNLKLSRTNNSLRWALDVTTCQNDKLIYIAPPIIGKGVVDQLEGSRILLVKGSRRKFSLPANVPTAEYNKQHSDKALSLLRAAHGLPAKPATKYLSSGSIEYATNPDVAQVTGAKEDGPYIHLNLNGGDSWAYWHPKTNPEFIYNFKNEPVFRTQDLLPEYWETVRPVNSPAGSEPGNMVYLAFRDFKTATYHNAIWDEANKKLTIAPARSTTQLDHFLKSHGQPKRDFVPDWTVEFNPHSNTIVDLERKIINEFQPTKYMLLPKSDGAKVPPLIRKTLWNAFGSDTESYERFLNWLAVSFQFRVKCQTGWITHGTTGTGKGTLVNKVLKPIFGYVEIKRSRDLDSIFNEFLEKALLLWIDEAEVGGKNGGSVVENDMKNYITEPVVSIRRMHLASYEARSYISVILSSNNGKPMVLRPNDRRFNIAPFQKEALIYLPGEYDAIDQELEEFAQYLLSFRADQDLARVPLLNEAKKAMIYINRAGIDVALDAVRNGNFQFFADHKPLLATASNTTNNHLALDYCSLVDRMKGAPCLLREELHLLLGYLLDDIPRAPHKFSSMLKHHDIIFTKVDYNGKPAMGIKVDWK